MCYGDTTKQFTAPNSHAAGGAGGQAGISDFSLHSATNLQQPSGGGLIQGTNPAGLGWDLSFLDSSLFSRDFAGFDWGKMPDPLGLCHDFSASASASASATLFPEHDELGMEQHPQEQDYLYGDKYGSFDQVEEEKYREEKSPLSQGYHSSFFARAAADSESTRAEVAMHSLNEPIQPILPATGALHFDPRLIFAPASAPVSMLLPYPHSQPSHKDASSKSSSGSNNNSHACSNNSNAVYTRPVTATRKAKHGHSDGRVAKSTHSSALLAVADGSCDGNVHNSNSKTKEASRRSRLRKKIYVESLERSAKALSEQHEVLQQQLLTLATENKTFKEQLADLRAVIMHTTLGSMVEDSNLSTSPVGAVSEAIPSFVQHSQSMFAPVSASSARAACFSVDA